MIEALKNPVDEIGISNSEYKKYLETCLGMLEDEGVNMVVSF